MNLDWDDQFDQRAGDGTIADVLIAIRARHHQQNIDTQAGEESRGFGRREISGPKAARLSALRRFTAILTADRTGLPAN
jgi:hypothetical protein